MDSCCKSGKFRNYCENAIQLSSTDIHLQCGQPIYLRHGDGLKATSFMCTTRINRGYITPLRYSIPMSGNLWMKLVPVVACVSRVHLYQTNPNVMWYTAVTVPSSNLKFR